MKVTIHKSSERFSRKIIESNFETLDELLAYIVLCKEPVILRYDSDEKIQWDLEVYDDYRE